VVDVTGEIEGVVRVAAAVEDEDKTLADGCTASGGAPTGLAMRGSVEGTETGD